MTVVGKSVNGSLSVKEKEEKILLEPVCYISQSTGSGTRFKLMNAFNVWLNVCDPIFEQITSIIDMLHTASLVIDDIEDFSSLRRGIPASHSVYGIPASVNSANYAYFLSLQKLIDCLPKEKQMDAIRIFSRQMIQLHRGQGLEIYWRENYQCPSEEEYVQVITLKTSGLFGMAIELLQLFSDFKGDLSNLVYLIGKIYQIRNDYLAFVVNDEKKVFAEDLTEGKFTLPIIHAIHFDNNNNSTLINILRQRTTDINLKHHAISIMNKCGSLDYCLKKLREMDLKAREEVENLGLNDCMVNLLDILKIGDLK